MSDNKLDDKEKIKAFSSIIARYESTIESNQKQLKAYKERLDIFRDLTRDPSSSSKKLHKYDLSSKERQYMDECEKLQSDNVELSKHVRMLI